MSEKIAIRYTGPWLDFTGYGEANRNAIMALYTAGVDITTERVVYTDTQTEYGEAFEIARKMEGKPIHYDIKIIHVPSDGYLKFLEPTKYHIGHLFWETDGLSKTWVWNCNLMDEIWTGGHSHKEALLRAGVKVPIYVFPQAVDTNIKTQPAFKIPGHQGYLFYSIFQWIERKNPKALLKAYWEEFRGMPNVSLLIKTYRFGFKNEEREAIKRDILDWKKELGYPVKEFPRTLLYLDLIKKEDVMRLHMTGDCFVSAHRGEGWGIPQAEALAIGNPIISTNLGGIHEWLNNERDAFLVNWTKTKVFNMDFAPWYDKEQGWAEVDKTDLKTRMRYCFENPEKAREVGLRGQELVKNKLSYLAVGTMIKDRLEEIQRLVLK